MEKTSINILGSESNDVFLRQSIKQKNEGLIEEQVCENNKKRLFMPEKIKEMLRKEYEGKEPFFDLANIESTFPHGKRASFAKNGSIYYSMVPEYTYDGGHLNKVGRRRITEQLLVFLANLSD